MGKLPENILLKLKQFLPKLKKLFAAFVTPSLLFVRRSTKEVVTTNNNNLVGSLMRILDCYFVNYADTETKKINTEELDQLD